MMLSIESAGTRLLAIGGACALLAVGATDASARTLAEVKALGAISVCLNPDALPYSSNKPETPGFQLELAREIAKGLGVKLNVEWILPRRRANVVNCDMMIDSVNDRGDPRRTAAVVAALPDLGGGAGTVQGCCAHNRLPRAAARARRSA